MIKEIYQEIKRYLNLFLVANSKLKSCNHIICSISGGSDSDIMMGLFCRIDKEKVKFVFFDTGLEYKATKDHLNELQDKYDIELEWKRLYRALGI